MQFVGCISKIQSARVSGLGRGCALALEVSFEDVKDAPSNSQPLAEAAALSRLQRGVGCCGLHGGVSVRVTGNCKREGCRLTFFAIPKAVNAFL